jgi:hypothetical protein
MTVYVVIADPLLLPPETAIVTWPSPIVALREVGAVGRPAGTAAGDVVDETPVPIALIAFAVNVYEVPLVRPVILQLVAGVTAVQVAPLLAVMR